MIGAAGPTSDYWQADEAWWEEARKLAPATGLIYGVVYDESARMLAIDMALPLYTSGENPVFLGVLKTSLHASPSQWAVMDLGHGCLSLAAAVPLTITRLHSADDPELHGSRELLVVVSRDVSSAMGPVRLILRQLTLCGVLVALLFTGISFFLVRYWLVRPIRLLRKISISMVECIKQTEQGRFEESWESRQDAADKLSDLESIRTKDELQDLSSDFMRMGQQLLSFLRQISRR